MTFDEEQRSLRITVLTNLECLSVLRSVHSKVLLCLWFSQGQPAEKQSSKKGIESSPTLTDLSAASNLNIPSV